MWGILKTNVANRHPSSMEELEQFAKKEWGKIDLETEDLIKSLVELFSIQLQAVIDREAYWYT
jgi:hypothetical protein